MSITFSPSTMQGYAAEATVAVNNDFCLHMELEREGTVSVFLSAIQGKEGQLKRNDRTDQRGRFVDDYDILLAPKYVTIRTSHPVLFAEIQIKED